jgi:drug/metabolite transporter (DMT)-like permease
VLAAQGAVTMTINCVMSMIFLKERMLITDWLGIFILCIGTLLIVMIAAIDVPEFTPDSLLEAYGRAEAILFLIVFFVYIFFAHVMDLKLKKQLKI